MAVNSLQKQPARGPGRSFEKGRSDNPTGCSNVSTSGDEDFVVSRYAIGSSPNTLPSRRVITEDL